MPQSYRHQPIYRFRRRQKTNDFQVDQPLHHPQYSQDQLLSLNTNENRYSSLTNDINRLCLLIRLGQYLLGIFR